MDWSVVAGDAVLAAGTVVTAVIAARNGRATRRLHRENTEKLERIEMQTNGQMDERIYDAVQSYVREHPGMVSGAVVDEALRDLLNAIIRHNLDEEDGSAA